MERRKYLFKGRVQGVGFRFRCFSIANELKLTGFVKNEYDGSVSMEVQGEGMIIERMIEKAKSMGANAVIGMKIGTSAVMAGASEVIAYGTAVLIEE